MQKKKEGSLCGTPLPADCLAKIHHIEWNARNSKPCIYLHLHHTCIAFEQCAYQNAFSFGAGQIPSKSALFYTSHSAFCISTPTPISICQRHFHALNFLFSVQWNDDIRSFLFSQWRIDLFKQNEKREQKIHVEAECSATHRCSGNEWHH